MLHICVKSVDFSYKTLHHETEQCKLSGQTFKWHCPHRSSKQRSETSVYSKDSSNVHVSKAVAYGNKSSLYPHSKASKYCPLQILPLASTTASSQGVNDPYKTFIKQRHVEKTLTARCQCFPCTGLFVAACHSNNIQNCARLTNPTLLWLAYPDILTLQKLRNYNIAVRCCLHDMPRMGGYVQN